MQYRLVNIESGAAEFGEWTEDALEAMGEARAINESAGFPCAWVEDRESNRVTPTDIRTRATDETSLQGIYGAAVRVSSHTTAGKLISAIAQAERGK